MEIYVPAASNSFSYGPRLYATALENEVVVEFSAVQRRGRLWIVVVEAGRATNKTSGMAAFALHVIAPDSPIIKRSVGVGLVASGAQVSSPSLLPWLHVCKYFPS